ncbi:MAG: ATP-grasp domain-containing protein, partial [Lentisphaerae bacterium]
MIRNILFLNAGRRCELIRAFRETLNARGGGKIVASDIVTHAPALHVADTFYILPPRDNPNAIPELIDLCRKEKIQLIIPTIDPDLVFLDTIRTQLQNELPDLHILLPPSHVVQIAANKIRTRAFFQEAGYPPPPAVDIHQPEITFPIFVKPVAGSASQGILKIDNRRQLQLWLTTHNPQEYIIERYIPGEEYTVDLISDQQASPLAAVCRRRLRVRGGEVVHARIEDLPELRDIAFELATKLQSTGPTTLQFRRPDPNTFIPIEINARMGGGLPLTIASGYNWPAMILQTLENPRQRLTPPAPRYLTMTMSRYDQSIFTSDTAPDSPRLIVRPSRKIPAVKAVIVDLDDTLYPEVD